jgi:hypothetical protein
MSVDHGGYGIGGIMKPIHKLEPQRDQQSKAQEQIRHDRSRVHRREVREQVIGRIANPHQKNDSKSEHAYLSRTSIQLGMDCGNGCRGSCGSHFKDLLRATREPLA